MPYVPGNAAEGYCQNCKRDTVQTVLEVDGLQVRLARCDKCGTEAPLKVSRAKTKKGLREALSSSRKASPVKRRTRKAQVDPAQVFRKEIEGKDMSAAKEYSIRVKLEKGDIVRHKRFGTGVVKEIVDANKALIIFEDGDRNMAFGK